MLPARQPLSDVRRQRLRDDRMWTRKVERALRLQASRVHCPCTECQGRRKLLLTNVRKHLMKNGRHPHCRVWRGPGN